MSAMIIGFAILFVLLAVCIEKLNRVIRLIEYEAKELRVMIKQLRGE